MKKYLMLLLTIVFIACSEQKSVNTDFVNSDCNIPIIECVIGNDTVDMIVDSGAEYSLISSEYLNNHNNYPSLLGLRG